MELTVTFQSTSKLIGPIKGISVVPLSIPGIILILGGGVADDVCIEPNIMLPGAVHSNGDADDVRDPVAMASNTSSACGRGIKRTGRPS